MYVVVGRYAQFEVFGALDCQLLTIDQDIGSSGMREFVEECSVRSFRLYLCCVCIPVVPSFVAFAAEAVEVVERCRGPLV